MSTWWKESSNSVSRDTAIFTWPGSAFVYSNRLTIYAATTSGHRYSDC